MKRKSKYYRNFGKLYLIFLSLLQRNKICLASVVNKFRLNLRKLFELTQNFQLRYGLNTYQHGP